MAPTSPDKSWPLIAATNALASSSVGLAIKEDAALILLNASLAAVARSFWNSLYLTESDFSEALLIASFISSNETWPSLSRITLPLPSRITNWGILPCQ